MAKPNPFAGKKAPPFGKGRGGGGVAREAKAEGEPTSMERKEMAMGMRRGGKVKRK
jgi:hypothetical protein